MSARIGYYIVRMAWNRLRFLDNALISLRSFGQRVGLDYRFTFLLGYEIHALARYSGPFCWLPMILMRLKSSSISEIESGSASAPITINLPSGESSKRVEHHGFGRVGGAEDDVGGRPLR